MFQQIITKISKSTHKIEYLYRNNLIGYVSFFNPTKNSIDSSITKIYIYPKYRHNNLGSSILKLTESYLNNTFGITKLSVVAWVPSNIHNNVSQFYNQNGYTPSLIYQSSIYDDGDIMYDIVPLVKNISQN